MQKLYWLDQIQPEIRLFVGEKAFNLSCLLQQGYPVLPGFVISASILREFVKICSSNSILADFPDSSLHLDLTDYQTLKNIAQNIWERIVNATLPQEWLEEFFEAAKKLDSPTLILRSSFSVEQPVNGLFPAKICACTIDSLASVIKLALADFFDTKSLLYWQKNRLSIENVNFAILVQPIRDAIASGIAEIKTDTIDIYSTWGLGFSLVRGEIEPDYYQFDRIKGSINKHLGKKIISYKLNLFQRDDYLEYNLNEARWDNMYSLDNETLSRLIEIFERIGKTQLGTIEWIINQGNEENQRQIYLTQFNLSIVTISKDSNMGNYQLLVKGLAASPGEAIAPARVMIDLDLQSYPTDQILVTQTLTPDWLNLLRHSKGIIAEEGGMTSHAAILARELGIPAVVAAKNITNLIASGDTILLNGSRGEVYQVTNVNKAELDRKYSPNVSPLFNYPIATKLLVNLSQVSSLTNLPNLLLDGVGLLRSELMLLDLLSSHHLKNLSDTKNRAVFLENFTESLTKFASAFYPRPVFYRFLDIGEDFPLSLSQKLPKYRGTYNYCLQPDLFELQLEVLMNLKTKGYDNINLILPFVRRVEEFVFCRRRIDNLGGINSFDIWIMAEVPSVLFLLPEYVKEGLQGIAIGTNDLTELILGNCREKSLEGLTVRHPAVLTAIQQLITQAKSLEIPCSICGLAPVQYPDLIDKFIEWGVTSLSVEADAIVQTYNAIARAEQRLLLQRKG